jgi:endonuclease YncB( thermonuclease family)
MLQMLKRGLRKTWTDLPGQRNKGVMTQKRSRQPVKTFLLTALLCLSAAAQPQTITGKVVGVSDGDTITVLDDQKRQHKIRLDGIDAPESNQDYGSRAKQSLSDLVFGKTVTVTSAKRDRYGRVLGQVLCDGKSANIEQF